MIRCRLSGFITQGADGTVYLVSKDREHKIILQGLVSHEILKAQPFTELIGELSFDDENVPLFTV